jgi:flagellar motor switch protein FliN/FliY
MQEPSLSQEEFDALAEICNICFGAAANRLSNRYSQPVKIAKPKISLLSAPVEGMSFFTLGFSGDYAGQCFFAIDPGAAGSVAPDPAGLEAVMTEIAEASAEALTASATKTIRFSPAQSGGAAAAGSLESRFQFRIGTAVDTVFCAYFDAAFAKSMAGDFLQTINSQMQVLESAPSPAKPRERDAGRFEGLEGLLDLDARVSVRLANRRMRFKELWELCEGDIIPLEKKNGQPLEAAFSGRVFARGEAVVTREKFGLRITEVCR